MAPPHSCCEDELNVSKAQVQSQAPRTPHGWGLLALTAPEEPPIFSSSRKDNLESSWAGLAGGGPSFSHP